MRRPTKSGSKTPAKPAPPPVELGTHISRARAAARLTQRELGARLGVTARTVLRWEVGRFSPPARIRTRLLASLVEAGTPLVDAVAGALGMVSHVAARKGAIDAAIRAAGELADAKPSAMRAAILHVLAAADEHGITVHELRERLGGIGQEDGKTGSRED